MKNLFFDNFIETAYYRVIGGEGAVSVNEFLLAVTHLNLYNCGYSINIDNGCEQIYDEREKTYAAYKSDFVNYLKDIDDEITVEAIVPISLARICTPSFTLICDGGRKIEVRAFASFYGDSYFSITHIYHKLDFEFSPENKNNLANWNFVKKIRIDNNIAKVLDLSKDQEIKKTITTKKYADISLDTFRAATCNDKFGIGKIVVQKSLYNLLNYMSGLNYTEDSHIVMMHEPFAYMILYTDIDPQKISVQKIENITYQGEESEFQNEKLRDTGTDLTTNFNCIIRGYYKFMFDLSSERVDPEKLLIYFPLFDACYLEKVKFIEAISEIRHLVYGDNKSNGFERLSSSRYHYLRTAKNSLIYEYKEDFSLTVNAIRQSLGLGLYEQEYNKICQIAEEVIVKQKEQSDLNRAQKQTNAINILTIVLSIPSVTVIVDVFYGLNIFNDIELTINEAKLIWIIVALCISITFFYYHPIKKVIKNMLEALAKTCKIAVQKIKQLAMHG